MKTPSLFVFIALCTALFALAPVSIAQEAINTDAALQPPPGVLIFRQQLRYRSLEAENGPAKADVFMSSSNFIYGLSPEVTLIGAFPLMYRELETGGGSAEDYGIGDMNAMVKYQVYKNNFDVGGTLKAGLLGGARFPSFDETFSSDSIDPIGGGVVTFARDRHGLSLATTYLRSTGGDTDEVRYDLGYTFRVQPASFAGDDSTALFAVLEINGLYETNGDNETLLSPGVQYVTSDWTIEATFQFPIVQDVARRMQTEYAMGLLFRLRF